MKLYKNKSLIPKIYSAKRLRNKGLDVISMRYPRVIDERFINSKTIHGGGNQILDIKEEEDIDE